jgi:hypothetical protein
MGLGKWGSPASKGFGNLHSEIGRDRRLKRCRSRGDVSREDLSRIRQQQIAGAANTGPTGRDHEGVCPLIYVMEPLR